VSGKLRIGVIFGGRSGEHEVSLRSASSIIAALDPQKYEVVPIGITKEGNWLTVTKSAALSAEKVLASMEQAALQQDLARQELLQVAAQSPLSKATISASPQLAVDVVFPVLHGTYGEDGTIQGLLEMADLPYVGCGVLASAVGMDKVVMKQLFAARGLALGPYSYFLRSQWEQDANQILNRLEATLRYPMFVKPANSGSSVGISKAKTREELIVAIELAAKYDRKILVEQGLRVREFEVSVLGNDTVIASLPGEVIPGAEFYDYYDKYVGNKTQFEIPAQLSTSETQQLQEMAITAFQAIDGSGLARVDFFWDLDNKQFIINEINTLPGFTAISMYPKLWQASGLSYVALLDRLIKLALERHQEKTRNLTSYEEDRSQAANSLK
jgi:D-alanine-D-alanine ligase